MVRLSHDPEQARLRRAIEGLIEAPGQTQEKNP